MGVTAAPDVMFQTVENESVLLNLKTGIYLGLDPIGTRMWIALTEADSVQEAFDSLLEEFDVSAARLALDLAEFLEELNEHGLITVKPSNLTNREIPERSR